ncbi:MAG: hypothetical protein PHQ23_06705 [Candidatus Wallbacteria bacterium]|nr:hypothetical protein [Candidatus Wallbacteria bacterium]
MNSKTWLFLIGICSLAGLLIRPVFPGLDVVFIAVAVCLAVLAAIALVLTQMVDQLQERVDKGVLFGEPSALFPNNTGLQEPAGSAELPPEASESDEDADDDDASGSVLRPEKIDLVHENELPVRLPFRFRLYRQLPVILCLALPILIMFFMGNPNYAAYSYFGAILALAYRYGRYMHPQGLSVVKHLMILILESVLVPVAWAILVRRFSVSFDHSMLPMELELPGWPAAAVYTFLYAVGCLIFLALHQRRVAMLIGENSDVSG